MVTGKNLRMASVVGVEGESIRQYSPVKYEFTYILAFILRTITNTNPKG
jgi:hypothetical protein